ncbi:MAG TPA: tetratricopeptide repeat protein [Thermoleophilaceae bacterium]
MHPRPRPKGFVPRPAQVAELRSRLAAPGCRVLAVLAVGGEGKSTVVQELLDEHGDEELGRIFTFSFERSTPEHFLRDALEFFAPDGPEPDSLPPYAQATRLAEALETQSACVVLNEFENLLGPEGSVRRGHLSSRELLALLESVLAGEDGSTRVILTSRLEPLDLVDLGGYDEYRLPPLSDPDALSYLRGRGITGDDGTIVGVANRYANHALSLAALAEFLIGSRWGGDIAGAATLRALPKGSTYGQRLASILDAYVELLSDLERRILVAIAASPSGVGFEAVAAVVDATHGLSDQDEVDAAVQELMGTVLIGYVESAPQERLLTSHPLIADYFLEIDEPADLAATRRTLAAFHESAMRPGEATSLGEARPGVAAFQQYLELGDYAAATRLYFDRLAVSGQLFWSGHYRICESLTAPLLEAAGRRAASFDTSEAAELHLNAGRVAAKTATVDQAVQAFDRAASVADPGSRARARATLYGVEVLVEGGRCVEAAERLSAALRNGDAGDRDGYRVLGRRGYVRACLGDYKEARSLLTRAVDGARADSDDGYVCLFLRVRADLEVRAGRTVEAHADIEEALAIAAGPASFRDYEGHLLRTRGDVCREGRGLDSALENYGAALRIARESGYRWLEAEALIGLARCAFELEGERERAVEYADRALEIAAAGGWWLEEGRAHVVKAAAGLLDNDRAASDSLAVALAIADASGHHLLKREVRLLHEEWFEGRF